MTVFPAALDTFPDIDAAGGDELDTVGKEHDAQHDHAAGAIVAIERRLMGVRINAADPAYAGSISAAYAAVVTAGGGTLVIPPGTYSHSSNVAMNSNLVSVEGSGSGSAILQAVGTARIIIRPTVFTVTQGPKISGFTVRADPAVPLGAVGIETGNVTGYVFDDIVIEHFTAGAKSVTGKSITANVATVATSGVHGFVTGNEVVIMGLGAPFDGTWTIASTPTTTTFTYACVGTNAVTVAAKALTSNVATLTTAAPHMFVSGSSVTIAGVDATFNGLYTITSIPTPYSFTYAKTAANVTLVAATGTASSLVADGGANSAPSIALLVHTATQTEINELFHIHLNNNAVGIRFTNPNPLLNSLARFNFHRLHINVNAGQIGWQMRDNGNLYTAMLNITGNMAGPGTFFDIGGTSTINRCAVFMGMEQTSGTHGTPYTVATTAFVLGYGEAHFENFPHFTGALPGGPRHTPGWRIIGPEALPVGFDSQVEGQIANFIGSGVAANVHLLLVDSLQDPYAGVGIMTGPNNRSPYVVMFDSATSAFVIYAIGSGAPNNLVEVMRFTNKGHVITSTGSPPAPSALAAAGTSPPAPLSSGNNSSGTFSLGTGTTPTAGAQARFTFSDAWPVIPDVTIGFLTGGCWDVQPILTVTTTYIEIVFRQVPAASQAVGTWAFSFHAKGSAT